MNIEIANKLVKLRKQNGLSQEELADKLGLSRQAVSKWERAEASPDTDNLICLAKLYNISLDELLSTDDDVDTIVEEQVKKEENKEKESGLHITDDGIHAVDDDGDEVIIDDDGIHFHDKDGKEDLVKKRHRQVYAAINGICMGLALIAYIVLGAVCNMWSTMWILFFVPDMIASVYKCIVNRELHSFNMVFASLFAFFLVCWVLFPEKDLWHPMWTVFLAIPVYHIITTGIENIVKGKNKNDDVIEDEDDKQE